MKQKKRDLKVAATVRHLFLIAGGLALFFATACRKPQGNTLRPQAAELYRKSAAIIRAYTDSFKNAPDSVTLLELEENFSSALTSLNFKYPSETCLEISEGENDTLTNLTEGIIELRDSLLYSYAHPLIQGDSIANDSIMGQVITN